jgi:hypothetical protein
MLISFTIRSSLDFESLEVLRPDPHHRRVVSQIKMATGPVLQFHLESQLGDSKNLTIVPLRTSALVGS